MQRVQQLRHCHLFLPGIWHRTLQQSTLTHIVSCDKENWIMQQSMHIHCPSLEYTLLFVCHLLWFRSSPFTTDVGNENKKTQWNETKHDTRPAMTVKTKKYQYIEIPVLDFQQKINFIKILWTALGWLELVIVRLDLPVHFGHGLQARCDALNVVFLIHNNNYKPKSTPNSSIAMCGLFGNRCLKQTGPHRCNFAILKRTLA